MNAKATENKNKTNRDNKKTLMISLSSSPMSGLKFDSKWTIHQCVFRSSYLETDKYSNLIFQAMEKMASNFNPCVKKTGNFIWEQILTALKNSTTMAYENQL